jgi:hypothetical protein
MVTRFNTKTLLVYALAGAATVFLLGCPGPQSNQPERPIDKVTIQGEITTVVKDDGAPGTIFKGTWCCKSCSSGSGPLKCSGCSSVPAGSGQGSCPTGGDPPRPILVDCPGTTTYDGGTATCY